MPFAPSEDLLCLPRAAVQIGKVGAAVGQMGGRPPRLALQQGERDSLISDPDAETRARPVGDGEADQFHGGIRLPFLSRIRTRLQSLSPLPVQSGEILHVLSGSYDAMAAAVLAVSGPRSFW